MGRRAFVAEAGLEQEGWGLVMLCTVVELCVWAKGDEKLFETKRKGEKRRNQTLSEFCFGFISHSLTVLPDDPFLGLARTERGKCTPKW